ncbi:hypothetical protein acsn021_33240 [Anaerocolumna cellulosilytica]|uniref:Uncharacterized protein n=1 Tax=Anaerocolumna cellulosilytica TaxID=433286 RepID=A0A6S6R9C2_9FIRM|nr:YmaF family protein [Anaerocolumna cellulosilytica]MBB5196852.1 hypothetical protein [Anaerocolumna cellulosilytica]BCJ95755.1 hypothetical protein acsn021_33240 [Anaerocolumna cellulosilytica]
MDNPFNNLNSPHKGCDCNHNKQKHVHEVLGSVEIAEPQENPHNHRFATVSGEAIPYGCDHFHEVKFRTDFYEEHFHEFCGRTSGAIPVGGGRHVHFLESVTSVNDGHKHKFRVATLIEDPISERC